LSRHGFKSDMLTSHGRNCFKAHYAVLHFTVLLRSRLMSLSSRYWDFANILPKDPAKYSQIWRKKAYLKKIFKQKSRGQNRQKCTL
jgi:hypothetical protein